jgi:hypothetical protein
MKKLSHVVTISLFAGALVSTATHGMFKAARVLCSIGGGAAGTVAIDYVLRGIKDKGRVSLSVEKDEYRVDGTISVTRSQLHPEDFDFPKK